MEWPAKNKLVQIVTEYYFICPDCRQLNHVFGLKNKIGKCARCEIEVNLTTETVETD